VSYLAEGAEDIGLPETVRVDLAAHLLGSLPSVLHDDDEGLAEALRRDSEFEANLPLGMTLEELDLRIEAVGADAACPSSEGFGSGHR
jgi:hypothetical protein